MEPKSVQEASNKPSFAKVAAMRTPSKPQPSLTPHEQNAGTPVDLVTSPPISHSSTTTIPSQQSIDRVESSDIAAGQDMDSLNNAVQGLDIAEQKDPEASGHQGDMPEDAGIKTEGTFEDDQTHLSNSSTKPTSFDSKSVASVATFAMDEKESLRPDDSASVQAADEDESLSGPVSSAQNSRIGSESSARRLHVNFGNGPEQLATSHGAPGILPRVPQFNGGLQIAGAVPPDPISNNFVISNPESFQNESNLHGFPKDPDEKLIEAMNSPKDRLLLLQLEEKIVSFIKDSKEQSLELPPCNAFGRLLAHKLGDYYHLTHFVDNNVTSVRLHRTPWCRLPTPLPMLQGANANNTPPPNAPAMKIMRRGGQSGEAGGSTAASSPGPSKSTSEIGGEGDEHRNGLGSSTGATPAKDRATLSREEREAKYQEARDRIFRDFPESKSSENSASAEHSANMSRSSSMSGRKKSHRQKTPHDDSFEARSQFSAFYPGMSYSTAQIPLSAGINEGTFTSQSHYMGPGSSPSGVNPGHNNQSNTIYTSHVNLATMPQYPSMGMSPNMGQGNSWQGGQLPQQPQPPPFSQFVPVNQQPPQMMSQQSSTRSSPAMNNYVLPNTPQYQQQAPAWTPSPYPGGLQQTATPRNPPPIHWPNYPPQSVANQMSSYPYGQVPNQPFNPAMQNPAAQHPLPGSFNRAPFNPQTRSFVPGGNSPGRYSGNVPQPQVNPQYMKPQVHKPHQWTPPQETPSYPIQIPSNSLPNNKPPMLNTPPNYIPGHRGPPVTQDSIAKWGTPAHLPPKPPPSEVTHEFDIKNRPSTLPAQSYPNNVPTNKASPLVVSAGTSLPKSSGGL